LQYSQAKSQRAAVDFSDLLQQLYRALELDDDNDHALANAIRTHYPVALVDEFQDTDPWQYGSLDRIYASDACTPEHALIMIGDPKQAIYSFRGADLATYLKARQQACEMSDNALHTLSANFRSSQGLVNAVNHLFAQCPHAFGTHRDQPIDFVSVQAKGSAQPLTHNGQTLAALTWMHLSQGSEYVRSGTHLTLMSEHFANLMAQLLNDRAAQPSDMAVLVRSQSQARQIQQALTERGVASVYLSDNSSVFASEEATSVWRLLSACLSPNHLPSVRGALASISWGLTPQELEHLLTHDDAWQAQLEQFHHWQHIWHTYGVLPLLHQWLHAPILGQTIAQRLLSQHKGERSLSNLLHLGELLQHAAARLQGPHAVLRHLEQAIIDPPKDVDSQKSRLETDDQCVQIITYHKSKGLQYPLVFIPFAGSFQYESTSNEEEDDEEVSATDEDMRLLYVALTRAQRAMWVGLAETQKDMSKGSANTAPKRSAVSILLQRETRGDMHQQLDQLVHSCADMALHTVHVDQPITRIDYLAPAATDHSQAARRNQRERFASWWSASYSTLTKGLITHSIEDEKIDDAQTDAQPSASTLISVSSAQVIQDVASPLKESTQAWQSIAGGANMGTLLHDLLEWQTHNGWPLISGVNAHANNDWSQWLTRQTQWLNIEPEQVALIEQWLHRLITTSLALASPDQANTNTTLALSQLNANTAQAEMAFHLPAHRVSTTWLDGCIGQHILPQESRPALQTRELNGMLTGFMDLVFEHQGRFWIMDYKSNKLQAYDEPSLTQAILDKRYDVQYVLYTLALHRLLRSRLNDYSYEQHIGGAVYYFLRGVDEPTQGLHIMRPPLALIEALDKAFAGEVLA
jgi:exodeoxyribonuclease V beta subunit